MKRDYITTIILAGGFVILVLILSVGTIEITPEDTQPVLDVIFAAWLR